MDSGGNKTDSIKHRSLDRNNDRRLRGSWQSGASSRDEDAGLLPKPSCVTILDRLSLTTIAVSWCDATAGHYGDQIWTTGIANKRAICVLTGAFIRRGDAVYRPRRSSTQLPANFDRVILASALPECESVPATDTVTRASTRPVSHKHHVTPLFSSQTFQRHDKRLKRFNDCSEHSRQFIRSAFAAVCRRGRVEQFRIATGSSVASMEIKS
ncbi:DUF3331 domain-containing protein [Paraburkholderia sp. RL18-103-BIB-C]